MRKGYIQASVAITLASGMFAVFAWTYSQLSNISVHASESDQRIAKLEEAVGTIKTDTTEIKGDLKSILKAVK